ncbi:MAG: haloacid dehalogenase type II [Rhodospirillaceae bacterium]|jgi:2-haloacid dehalogenase|nr:haloacid dehalogenase type II [Rhodospirillaceae bacterium]MBT3925413.1 haloacid dehalogenase type II [Rhodospirillaceae bacterium]MBT4427530.1 haloacid dehalogenase type II [Rhodospirillaceae bacterium]MBT5037650.1 haloacid dehalogenase type II [Rhodospirillaceae bacterium]MBT5674444.1 haloacid dehalogenase type II [Rhodospirillaceae bacterium]
MRISDYSALTFDCYGTLIDWERGMLAGLAPWLQRAGVTADENELLVAYGRHETVVQTENPALPYRDIVARVLGRLAGDFNAAASQDEMREFGNSVGLWPPFPDSVEAMAYLRRHFKLVAITNVDNRSFARTHLLLGEPFHAVVTAEDVGSYKPAHENFHYAFERLAEMAVPRDKILHVAQSLYHDIAPARTLGLANVWVDRQTGRGSGMTPPTDAAPDLRVATMEELAALHRAEG